MAQNDIKYTLKAQLTDNTVTQDVKDDKILSLVSSGTADKQRIISEIMALNPGLERETVEAVINLEQRVVQKLLLTGFRVNNGLYSAVAQFTGVVKEMVFDPTRNSVYVSFNQGSELREAIGQVKVDIIGRKDDVMYVAGGGAATRVPTDGSPDFVAIAGRNFTLRGANIKVAGNDPSVGITLTDADGEVTQIDDDMIGVNDPSKIMFIIPTGLADGTYKLTLTTQYGGNSRTFLKKPRSVEQTIYIGEATSGGGEEPGGDQGGGMG